MKRVRLVHDFNWDSRNRPYITAEWLSWRDWFCVLEWGNRNSDPVWAIGIEVHL